MRNRLYFPIIGGCELHMLRDSIMPCEQDSDKHERTEADVVELSEVMRDLVGTWNEYRADRQGFQTVLRDGLSFARVETYESDNTLYLSGDDSEAFIDSVENPPMPNDKLRAALKLEAEESDLNARRNQIFLRDGLSFAREAEESDFSKL